MATMRAVTFDPKEGVVFRENYLKPVRKPGEALIRVIRAGVCNTDIEITKGYANFSGVLGHEFVGVVEEIDDGLKIAKGQRVVGEINLSCGSCDVCAGGGVRKRNHCPNRTVLGIVSKDGTFADYVTLPAGNLHPVPVGVSDERAAFAEPLAAAFRIVEQGTIGDGAKVAILGDGKLGLLIAHAIESLSIESLTMFGRHPEKMKLLPESITVKVVEEGMAVQEDEFDVTIETTGNPDGLKKALAITRPLGKVVLKSTCAMASDFNAFPIVVKEIQVIGSRCGNFQMALEAMAAGRICPEKLITKAYPFHMAEDALKHAAKKGTLKIQLVFD